MSSKEPYQHLVALTDIRTFQTLQAELVESLRQEGPLKNGNKKLGIVKEHLRH